MRPECGEQKTNGAVCSRGSEIANGGDSSASMDSVSRSDMARAVWLPTATVPSPPASVHVAMRQPCIIHSYRGAAVTVVPAILTDFARRKPPDLPPRGPRRHQCGPEH